jgi:Cu2+-exporting ATPase
VAATVEAERRHAERGHAERVHVGGPGLIEHLGAAVPDELAEFARAAGGKGQSVIYLVRDGAAGAGAAGAATAEAAFATADVVRPESRAAVDELRDLGLEVAMITGDSEDVARAVAGELGIERVFAGVLPENKEAYVRQLQAEGKRVIMVGDGVNDAPALARADVGVAVGGGTDVAVESAGVVLVRDDPTAVAGLLRLSEASYRKMRQNIWWAAGYNIVAIPLAAGVLAPWGILPPPAMGAALMSLSTIIVAINAQTLRRVEI